MKIGVLGTGMVGSAVGGKLAALGHDVKFGSRDPASTKVRELADATRTTIGTHAEAAAHGEWVINAMPGEATIEVLRSCDIDGKILLDIGNYDHAVDRPVATPLGEAIQEAFPNVRLVKALNSVSAHLMIDPKHLGKPHTVFVASNDTAAKAEVITLLQNFGWEDIIDLGDLRATRAMEQLIPLWMALERVTGGPEFNLTVTRR